jgi:uncharacterized protein (DUF1810 family)
VNLSRFVEAQGPVIAAARAELGAGEKRSHWMWFLFPQIAGLGRSPMAQHYAIASLAEARAYLDHPVLGARLRELTGLVLAIEDKTAHEIFGSPDDIKFRSSMTLFDKVSPDDVFTAALGKYFAGTRDPLTQKKLGL